MSDTRKGLLKPEQEKIADDLIELKGIAEAADGVIIRMADNKGLESLKKKIVAKWGEEILPDIYEVVDEVFLVLEAIAKK